MLSFQGEKNQESTGSSMILIPIIVRKIAALVVTVVQGCKNQAKTSNSHALPLPNLVDFDLYIQGIS